MSKSKFKIGDAVQWKWYKDFIQGEVVEIYFEPVQREIKGSLIKRNGSLENPAYLVISKAKNYALKLETELSTPPKKGASYLFS